MKRSSSPRGFALVATLAILVVVTIFLVAFATTMRTERAASQNFVDRDRAESVGMGMVNRILAEHASPIGLDGERVQPFTLNPDNYSSQTGLPNNATATNYYAAASNSADDGPNIPIPTTDERKKLRPIYQMVPDNDQNLEDIGLVRTSKAATGGGPAYDSTFWAYDGLTDEATAKPPVVPEWVDYYQPDDPATTTDESAVPVAQVAFAIWDEGGKFDVNMVGEDPAVNGIAPHDLKIEETVSSNKEGLLDYLNGGGGAGSANRDRSNFSLRNIVSGLTLPKGRENDKGNDRWVFSVRELVERGLVDSKEFHLVTTSSRDFDVRPEWDGDRAPLVLRTSGSTLGAESFLRSYINDPKLYRLFYGDGGAGPFLVFNNLNESKLSDRLAQGSSNLSPSPNSSSQAKANWMQVMRLLAVLRRGLPPYTDTSAKGILTNTSQAAAQTVDPNVWLPYDIWAVGQNIAQATDAPSGFNLISYNGKDSSTNPNADPNSRVGTRISPYIVEAAIKVKRNASDASKYDITPYFKLWNPYPFDLTNSDGSAIEYRVGSYTGATYPSVTPGTGLFGGWAGQASLSSRIERVTAPKAGRFKIVTFPSVSVTSAAIVNQPIFRLRPYIEDYSYTKTFGSSSPYESCYFCLQMAGYNAGNNDKYAHLCANIKELPDAGKVKWYSFQIDDPRMASVRRNVSDSGILSALNSALPYPNPTLPAYKWSWILYNTNALSADTIVTGNVNGVGIETTFTPDSDITSGHSSKKFNGITGYNINFGLNWPGAGASGIPTQDDGQFAKMMATFALPGRPFLNIGELGTVFAYRPWVTLNFANRIIPSAKIVGAVTPAISDPTQNKASLRPAAILDYFTTVGTSETMDFNSVNDAALRYMDWGQFSGLVGKRPPASSASFQEDKRYQDKTWLFESLSDKTIDNQIADGNLRPIRGRINLNTASMEAIKTLLKAPYRMPASWGLRLNSRLTNLKTVNSSNRSDYIVTINEDDAEAMAKAITLPITDSKAIRPLRMLSDLSQLYDNNEDLMHDLYDKYPQSVISAMIGRLAQFGTVRAQCYTIDMAVRTLNPEAKKKGLDVITGEARLQARVYFDTFSRKAFIESVQYR